jgi:hypothetical protein
MPTTVSDSIRKVRDRANLSLMFCIAIMLCFSLSGLIVPYVDSPLFLIFLVVRSLIAIATFALWLITVVAIYDSSREIRRTGGRVTYAWIVFSLFCAPIVAFVFYFSKSKYLHL